MEEERAYFQLLPAQEGDSILIHLYDEAGKPRNILIDMGTTDAYHFWIKPHIETIFEKGEVIDLLICSHIDHDHIGGMIAFVGDDELDKKKVKEWWLNYGEDIKIADRDNRQITHQEGKSLASYLKENGFNHNEVAVEALLNHENEEQNDYEKFGARITILSPTEERLKSLLEYQKRENEKEKNRQISSPEREEYKKSIEELAKAKDVQEAINPKRPLNASSIALLIEYQGNTILLCADAHPKILVQTIGKLRENRPELFVTGKLRLDYCQLSHHGSKYNTRYKLLDLIHCQHFFISTDGECENNRHPNKTTMAMILHPWKKRPRNIKSEPITFYFNYKNDILNSIFTNEEKEAYNFCCVFPEKEGLGSKKIYLN